MVERGRGIQPYMLYGTAWKEEATEACVTAALAAGFRAIDTASQRRHYFEAGVGAALARAFDGGLPREALFIQTKFTLRRGQDGRLPYDPAAPLAEQVAQSHATSLKNLGIAHIDSYVLHGPSAAEGLIDDDWEVWGAMEELARAGAVGALAISNISATHLRELLADCAIRPEMVQNRCYASRGWDREVRELCAAEGIVYQGFSLLTANRALWQGPDLARRAAARGLAPAQLIFAWARELGMLPLTGTTNPEHMRLDLAALELTLSTEDRALFEADLT